MKGKGDVERMEIGQKSKGFASLFPLLLHSSLFTVEGLSGVTGQGSSRVSLQVEENE